MSNSLPGMSLLSATGSTHSYEKPMSLKAKLPVALRVRGCFLPVSTNYSSCAVWSGHSPLRPVMLFTLVTPFISSMLDYCNSVFHSVTKSTVHKLQVCINAAACLVLGLGKFEHIAPVLHTSYIGYLVQQRINCKIVILAFDWVHLIATASALRFLLSVDGPSAELHSIEICLCLEHVCQSWAFVAFGLQHPSAGTIFLKIFVCRPSAENSFVVV